MSIKSNLNDLDELSKRPYDKLTEVQKAAVTWRALRMLNNSQKRYGSSLFSIQNGLARSANLEALVEEFQCSTTNDRSRLNFSSLNWIKN